MSGLLYLGWCLVSLFLPVMSPAPEISNLFFKDFVLQWKPDLVVVLGNNVHVLVQLLQTLQFNGFPVTSVETELELIQALDWINTNASTLILALETVPNFSSVYAKYWQENWLVPEITIVTQTQALPLRLDSRLFSYS